MARRGSPVAVAAVAAAATAAGSGGCGGRPDAPALDRERTAALFDRIELDTAPGLSGLATDDAGALWAVSERADRAYRIALPPAGASGGSGGAGARPAVETLTITGVPEGFDLEGIAVLGGDRFALGTEGRQAGVATVLLAERRGAQLAVTGSIALPQASVGVAVGENHGAEGVCGTGGAIVVAIETAGEDSGRRWAPIVRISDGAVARTHRLWLTSPTGKLSGLDCRIAADGTVTGWTVERHFEVTRLLRFTLPPLGQGDADVTPVIALDLGEAVAGKLNLEGIAELPDGRVVTVIDNQWKRITGPSELLVIRPGALAPR